MNDYDSFPKDYKINQFKNRIKNNEFKVSIEKFIDKNEGNSIAEQIIDTAIKILEQGKINNDKVPAVLIKQWILHSSAPRSSRARSFCRRAPRR